LVTLLTGAWLVSHTTFAELDVVWLSLAPVFLLALPLVAGRYVGETHLERLSAGRRPRPRRRLFEQVGCATCHTLADAKSHGQVGPNLDDLKPSLATVEHQVTDGGGGCPRSAASSRRRRSTPSPSTSPASPGADRRRLARALRRPGKLHAVVAATAGGATTTLRLRL